MDLAKIRKKARLQEHSDGQAGELVDPIMDAPPETHSQQPGWLEGAEIALASEQEYSLGLVGRTGDTEDETVQWLTFFLGTEEYALELSVVLELIRPRNLTELPQVPKDLLGIVSLRGEMLPIIDLGKRLGADPPVDADQQRVIVCAGAEQRVGLLVDRVSRVAKLSTRQIEAAPFMLSGAQAESVEGVGRLQGRMLILLKPEKITAIES
ncbi:MAG: hypothetical protein C0618_04595 [Desulfuromonas sp.]|nr:MAG: hypothetical protein C0618_04595 [Desulfuromonas sp.]